MKLAPAFMAALGLALATPAATPSIAAEVDMNFAHFMPAGSWQNQELFTGWAQAVEEQSGGRIKVTIFPAQTLGKAPAGYDNAKNGVADIAWTVQGYTAGRFPLSHIVELPGLFETAQVGSCGEPGRRPPGGPPALRSRGAHRGGGRTPRGPGLEPAGAGRRLNDPQLFPRAPSGMGCALLVFG